MRLLLVSILVSICGVSAVDAACLKERIAWAFGRHTASTWRITNGDACTIQNDRPQNIAAIEITKRPSNGVAGRAPPDGWAYRPNPGFKGQDSFTVTITSSKNFKAGADRVATVHMTVIVE